MAFKESLYDFAIKNEKYKFLLDEWDYKRNEELGYNPKELGMGSHKKVYWVCSNGHSYTQIIKNRTGREHKCPVCQNQVIVTGINDLATLHPELLKEWDYKRNAEIGLYPDKVGAGSPKRPYWVCEYGHSWQTQIRHRVKNGVQCPICLNQKLLKGYNDFESQCPVLLKEWDYDKNNKLGIYPDKVMYAANKKVWWKDKKGHSWRANISARVLQGTGCPTCNKGISRPQVALYLLLKEKFNDVEMCKRIEGVEFDIYIKDINLAIEYDGAYFHYDKRDFDRRKNKIAEKKGFNFIRIYEHSDKLPINTNIDLDRNILYFKIGYEADIESLCKLILIYLNKNYNLNIPLIVPNDIKERANEFYRKEVSNEDGDRKPLLLKEANIVRENSKTHTNSGYKPTITGVNDLLTTHPEIVKEWDFEKNSEIGLFPDKVMAGSHYKAFFLCEKGHSYQKKISSKVKNGVSCPHCKREAGKISNNSNLLKYWDYSKNNISPDDITIGSDKKVYWLIECREVYNSPKYVRKVLKV